MAGSVQRQKVYVQVTEFCLLAKALRPASITPESPAKARQIGPRFTTGGAWVRAGFLRWGDRRSGRQAWCASTRRSTCWHRLSHGCHRSATLHRAGRTVPGAVGVPAGAVPADHLHAGMGA